MLFYLPERSTSPPFLPDSKTGWTTSLKFQNRLHYLLVQIIRGFCHTQFFEENQVQA
jgi:hypothetical protein